MNSLILIGAGLILLGLGGVGGWSARVVSADHRYIRALAERDEAAVKFYKQEYEALIQTNQKLYRRDANGKKTN
ncbi:MAG: hypothetical protein WCG34_11305 [Leptolinea sp.]